MDYLELKDEFEIHTELSRYQRLHRWLTYEGYSILIWGGGYFAPVGLIAVLALGAAIVFVPIMIHHLAVTQHRGWIVTWIILVFVPTVLTLIFASGQQRLMWTVLAFLPVSYIYFWMLRMAVDTWISNLQGKLELGRTHYYVRG